MSVLERVDAFQRRHPAAGLPIAVVYKYADDQGGYLAALITYYGLLALFPLLLLLSTVLGLVLEGDPGLQHRVLASTLHQFPVIGQDLGRPREIGGGTTGLIVGLAGSVYGALGVAQALQNATNTAWAVPRNERPNPIAARVRSVGLVATVGFTVLATTALTAVAHGAGGLGGDLGGLVGVALVLVTVAVNATVFAIAFRLSTARPLTLRHVAPGAVVAAVAWQVLQALGASYVRHVEGASSTTNGVFAVVLGLIAFLYVASVIVTLAVEINVVRVERLYPRALLTPFTDHVDLTQGDMETYAGRAEAERAKGFQQVDVTFGPRPRNRRKARSG